jgi:phosphoribosylaminoimidazole-succinocarboxamide synthase
MFEEITNYNEDNEEELKNEILNINEKIEKLIKEYGLENIAIFSENGKCKFEFGYDDNEITRYKTFEEIGNTGVYKEV